MRVVEEKHLVVRPGHEVIVRHTFRFLLDSCRSCHGAVTFIGLFAPLARTGSKIFRKSLVFEKSHGQHAGTDPIFP